LSDFYSLRWDVTKEIAIDVHLVEARLEIKGSKTQFAIRARLYIEHDVELDRRNLVLWAHPRGGCETHISIRLTRASVVLIVLRSDVHAVPPCGWRRRRGAIRWLDILG
jgi:hypothetical protein